MAGGAGEGGRPGAGGPRPSVADALLAELLADDGLVEVGYRDGAPACRSSSDRAPPTARTASSRSTSDSVVLITGGARGITAEVAALLAERAQPTLVLVGRTPAPEGEEDAQDGLADRAARTRARPSSSACARRVGDVTPAVVEAEYRRLIAAREVRESLARLRGSGARIEYLACDVRDGEAFGALIDDVYDRHGRIDGVVHGAGVIEDKLVRDKELGSFERVLATKAGAARTLAAKLRPETLALPRLLRLGIGPLRQPRPGRLRGGQRDPQQARARARPPLARPRGLDRLGPVAHDGHGLDRRCRRSSSAGAWC